MLTNAIGAFLGALLSLIAIIYIEYQRKPKLSLGIEDPPFHANYDSPPFPAKETRAVRVYLRNRAMPSFLRWLGRDPAMHCHGQIQFHHYEDGAPVFSKPMPIRWSASDEPLTLQALPNGQLAQLFDPTKYNAAFYRNCYPGSKELIDVAARFDADDDCYGWCNETYLPGKGWRNPDWKLSKGRYLVSVTVNSSGESISTVLSLENSTARQHFRLIPGTAEDARKLASRRQLTTR
jgi:hypothetical protein